MTLIFLFFLSACVITVTTPSGNGIMVELQGGKFQFIFPSRVNTPTPIFQRYLTIRASTNLRATPSTSSAVVNLVRVDTQALILSEQGDWYRVRIASVNSNFIEGWVRNDRVINPITVTATPQPTPTRPAPTPTQERILRLSVPFEGLQGYVCQSENCKSDNLRLEFLDNYRVLFMNNEWAWVCVLALDNETCRAQFYVRIDN